MDGVDCCFQRITRTILVLSMICRTLRERDGELGIRIVAADLERHGLPPAVPGDGYPELMVRIDAGTVQLQNNVFRRYPGFRRRRIRHDGRTVASAAYERAVVDRQLLCRGDFRRQYDVSHAEIRRLDLPRRFDRRDGPFRVVDGDGEADVLRAGGDRGIDAYHLALQVHERAAGIPRIDCGIRLDNAPDLLDDAAARSRHVARQTGNCTDRDGIPELRERVPDGDGRLTELDGVRIAECDRRESGRVYFHKRQVLRGVAC